MNVLIFYISSFSILIVIVIIGVKQLNNKISKRVVEILSHCNCCHSIKDIAMKYQENNGVQFRIWPAGNCDFYFCEDFAVVIKRHRFMIDILSKPFVFGVKVPVEMEFAQKNLIGAKVNHGKRKEYRLLFADQSI